MLVRRALPPVAERLAALFAVLFAIPRYDCNFQAFPGRGPA